MASSPISRPPLDRMLRIHEELRRGALPNCTSLGATLEVSRKTIIRDIAFMRDRLGLPIEYDSAAQAYSYSQAVESFPTIQVTEGEVVALLVATRALEQYQGTPYHHQLTAAFRKIAGGLSSEISFSAAGELDGISFRRFGMGRTDVEVFTQLSRAVFRRRAVTFDYRKTGDQSTKLRRVQPYHLSHRENSWYLVGWDEERQELRTFALPRITDVKALGRAFERPKDFSPDTAFAGALNALGGTRDVPVKVRFDREVADYIRERDWHESQVFEDLSDGSLMVTLRLGALAEIERWIFSWGPAAEVLEPPELRERIAMKARRMALIYSTRSI